MPLCQCKMNGKMTSLESLYELYLQHPQVTTDSRDCPKGSIFFALKGESFDGNLFAARALEQGCAAAVVDNPEVAVDDRFVLVSDVLETLQQLAAMHRRRWGKTVIQITGTNGKTTTCALASASRAIHPGQPEQPHRSTPHTASPDRRTRPGGGGDGSQSSRRDTFPVLAGACRLRTHHQCGTGAPAWVRLV